MSYRVCGQCDYVINNRTHDQDECPRCNSLEMCDPTTDERDWDKLYHNQNKELLNPNDRYSVVWHNDNPSTYVESCNSWKDVLSFFKTLSDGSGEYISHIIRQSDMKNARVLDGKIEDFK